MNPVCAPGFTIPRAYLNDRNQAVRESLAALKAAYPSIIVWDPFPVLCSGAVCSAFAADGRPLFFDGDHLSSHGARVLAPSFEEIILEMLP